ncbi:MAG TPA: hypothetical protein VFO86_09380, partial [Terriglobia bacterium]|nr:hypothetical protein [Terriglobia bacterium]
EFQANTVVNRSAFINPAEIGYLTDDEEHCVVLNSSDAYFCSQPSKLRQHTGVSLKEFLLTQTHVLNPTSAVEVAAVLNKIIGVADERVPSFSDRSLPQALQYISFVAHVFLHSEVFFVPAATEQAGAG